MLLRYTLIVSTAYLLLVERQFAMPPLGVMLLIVLALASNVACAQLPERLTQRSLFSAGVIVFDTLWITATLVYSGSFGADFFYLYFFVLLLAAIGESLQVIALTAIVVCAAYLYVLRANGTILSWWQSPSLIRLPFLFTTAAFYGYLIDRTRREQRRVREQAFADLERLVEQRTADLTATNHELSAFAYSVSHDLRAPLRAIDAFSQALLEDYADVIDAQGQDYLRRVRTNTSRMGQLIDDLLQLSRLTRSEMHFEAIDLSGLARSIVGDLQRTQPHRQVTAEIQTGVIARGDPRLLRVLLENLLGNAWKYTSRQPHARIAFGVTGQDGEQAYYVRDDGCGFDLAYADKLFRPFQRLHTVEEYEGAGVGLATAQRVVRRHGGRIWADSAPGRGATFYFTLATPLPRPQRDPEQLAAA
ncbi:MAG: ATP-binding protein [Deltaproteobacteria bacterium]|nr:ATP-binding protein [Deltaproteobacteria bacterium]